jgi:hypothetical protein
MSNFVRCEVDEEREKVGGSFFGGEGAALLQRNW